MKREKLREKSIKQLAEEIKKVNLANGWKTHPWNTPIINKTVPESLVMIHDEVSEALREFNADNFEGFKREIVDIIIRCFDLSVDLGFHKELEKIILEKNEKNSKRGFKHGKKI